MVLTGISAKLKDRRVDRILEKHGYIINTCAIFYSPIMVWLILWPFLLLAILASVPFLFYYLIYRFLFCFLLYFMFGYVTVAYLNNSFIITEDKLLVVNPNFPFRCFVTYDIQKIQKVKISASKKLWLTMIFAHFGNNYVEVITSNETHRYYCTSLQLDAFDENFTEQTMDDFHASLKQNNIVTEFNLG